MESKYEKKNLKLISEFDEYMWKDPERWNLLPYGCNIVMAEQGDPSFNRFSRKISKNGSRPNFTFVEARKVKKDWIISPLAF
jgi:hypothetical protein